MWNFTRNKWIKKINIYDYEKYQRLNNLIKLCVNDLLITEIEKSTRDETEYEEFRNVYYLHDIDKNAQRYVSIYEEYIRNIGIDIKKLSDDEYKDFIKKVFIEKGKYVGTYAYQQYLLNKEKSEYETHYGYGEDNLHLYKKSDRKKNNKNLPNLKKDILSCVSHSLLFSGTLLKSCGMFIIW